MTTTKWGKVRKNALDKRVFYNHTTIVISFSMNENNEQVYVTNSEKKISSFSRQVKQLRWNVISLLLVGIALPLMVFVALQRQNLKQEASISQTPETSFSLQADKTTVNVGDTLTVKVKVRLDVEPASYFVAKIAFDPKVLSITALKTDNKTSSNLIPQAYAQEVTPVPSGIPVTPYTGESSPRTPLDTLCINAGGMLTNTVPTDTTLIHCSEGDTMKNTSGGSGGGVDKWCYIKEEGCNKVKSARGLIKYDRPVDCKDGYIRGYSGVDCIPSTGIGTQSGGIQATSTPKPQPTIVTSDYFIQSWIEKKFNNETGIISLYGKVPPMMTSIDRSSLTMAEMTFTVKSLPLKGNTMTVRFMRSDEVRALEENRETTTYREIPGARIQPPYNNPITYTTIQDAQQNDLPLLKTGDLIISTSDVSPSLSVTPAPSVTPVPSISGVGTITIAPSPTVVSTTAPLNIFLNFTVLLSGSVDQPAYKIKNLNVEILDINKQKVQESIIGLTYDSQKKIWNGGNALPWVSRSGDYYIRVKVDGYLKKFVQVRPITLTLGERVTLPAVTLIPGDITNDNKIDQADYAQYKKCFEQSGRFSSSCTVQEKEAADLNQDGKTDSLTDFADYKLLNINYGLQAD